MIPDSINHIYLPFTLDQLRQHFTCDQDGQIEYYLQSAERYQKFMEENKDSTGIPLSKSKYPRQIEKDERFWTLTSLKQVYDDPKRVDLFSEVLTHVYGEKPPLAGDSKLERVLGWQPETLL